MTKFPRWSGVAPGLFAGLVVTATLALTVSRADAANSAIFGGGPFYKNAAAITEIKNSGFREAVVWNIAVNTSGDLNFNYEFLLCSGGTYVGNSTYAGFASSMATLKQGGSVKRLTFSIGSSNTGVFQAVRDLINSQGTGSTSILYRNFQALKTAIPSLDALDFDDENCYDTSTMVQFAVMLGNLGYKVSLDPYTNSTFWKNVASQVNSQRPGTIDRIKLQCYAGGGGNSPNPTTWNFNGVPVEPGLWDNGSTVSAVQTKMANWRSLYGITGGWMWLYDDFVGNGLAAQYASAINTAIGSEPNINSATTATGTTGTAFNYQITATDSPTSYGASGLPPGLSVATSTGVVSGTPTQAGTFSVTLSATNSVGTNTATLTLTVKTPFNVWQSQYFSAFQLNVPAISGPNAILAGDGITNLMKYALGLNPKLNGTAGLPTVGVASVNGSDYLTLTYTKVLAATDISYTVEVSGDLQAWSSGAFNTTVVSIVNNPDGTTQTVTARSLVPTSNAASRYIRLKIVQP